MNTSFFNPIFIAAKLNPISALAVNLVAKNLLGGLIPPDCLEPIEEYHATLLYEKKGTSIEIPYSEPLYTCDVMKARGVGINFSYMGKGIIAMVMSSPYLRAVNKVLYAKSLSRSQFSSYVPHITVAKNVEHIPKLPTMIKVPVYFDYLYSAPLKGD